MADHYRSVVEVKRSLRESARVWMHRVGTPIRRRYYRDGWGRRPAKALSSRWRHRLGLDDDDAVGSKRLEIGSGVRPLPGYIHVDLDPFAWHVEAIAPAWRLPFPDNWAEEIVAIHSLEHVHPYFLLPTLTEWRRVLRPGGRLRVHVPNAPRLMECFIGAPLHKKWALMGALLGMYCTPDVVTPRQLIWPSDHQILFDRDLLRWALESAGYCETVDLTSSLTDVHTDAWKGLVGDFSIIYGASKDGRS